MTSLAKPKWDRHLSSILDQSRPPDEIIVVVDRQTSASERRAFEKKWPRIHFIYNDSNIGITASLNRGLGAAKGDYIFRADDDDNYRYDRIKMQLDCFAEAGVDFVASWAEAVIDNGTEASYTITSPTGDGDIRAALQRRNVLIHPSLAFDRQRILALGSYDETFRFAQDYALYLAASRAGYSFAVVPEVLLQRRYSPNSITVGRRREQLMFSCAAKITHHAHSGNRIAFLKTLLQYALLAITPTWLRQLRRRAFRVLGRGL